MNYHKTKLLLVCCMLLLTGCSGTIPNNGDSPIGGELTPQQNNEEATQPQTSRDKLNNCGLEERYSQSNDIYTNKFSSVQTLQNNPVAQTNIVSADTSKNTVTFEYIFTAPKNAKEVSIWVGNGYDVISSGGISKDGSYYTYNTKGRSSAYLKIQADVTKTSGGQVNNDWFFMGTPTIVASWETNHTTYCSQSNVGFENNITSEITDIVYSDGYIYGGTGPHEVYSSDMKDTTVTVVIPDQVTFSDRTSKEEVLNRIMSFESIDVDASREKITVYILPFEARSGGATTNRQYGDSTDMWVRSGEVIDTTIPHEIVHSKQDHTVSSDMEWWIEGSAEYIGGLMQYRRTSAGADIAENEFGDDWYDHPNMQTKKGELTQDVQEIRLSQSNTWYRKSDYIRGARVLYLIDTKLREETNGQKNIFSILRWMNHQSGPITYEEFRGYLSTYIDDEEFLDKIDSHVTGTKSVKEDDITYPKTETNKNIKQNTNYIRNEIMNGSVYSISN